MEEKGGMAAKVKREIIKGGQQHGPIRGKQFAFQLWERLKREGDESSEGKEIR